MQLANRELTSLGPSLALPGSYYSLCAPAVDVGVESEVVQSGGLGLVLDLVAKLGVGWVHA